MDLSIFLILLADGVVNGAIYALIGLALVLIFTVTRVVFVPIGEFAAYGALTAATLEAGRTPRTLWLLLALGIASALASLVHERAGLTGARVARIVAEGVLLPLAIGAGVVAIPFAATNPAVCLFGSVAIIAPMGPYLFNLVYRPIADASVLALLVVSVALHLALAGLGLVFFGAEGSGTRPLSKANFAFGDLFVTGQALAVLGVSIALMIALYGFFGRTLFGKALRATAVNRLGARLVGISPVLCGKLGFLFATTIGALSGVLASALTTIYYDTGFLMSLKGFVAAIVGGMVSYPLAVAAALFVGLLEAFSSFHASAFKEVIIFLAIIPVLLWRSLTAHTVEDED